MTDAFPLCPEPPSDEAFTRLAKRVAALVPCSRREAECYILGAWVEVDGQVVEAPQARVGAQQQVVLRPGARADPLPAVTVLWHKPAGLALPQASELPDDRADAWLGAATRNPRDASGLRPLQALRHRLRLLAPLSSSESGLVVLSQHVGVAQVLQDQAHEQEWLIDPVLPPSPDEAWRADVVRALTSPSPGSRSGNGRAGWQSERRVRLVLKGAAPGEVAARIERAGLQGAVSRRQRLGRLGLTGLAPGEWRHLLPHERF